MSRIRSVLKNPGFNKSCHHCPALSRGYRLKNADGNSPYVGQKTVGAIECRFRSLTLEEGRGGYELSSFRSNGLAGQ